MKKSIYIFSIGALLFSATSCSDHYLDTSSKGGDIDQETMFSSLKSVEYAINGMGLLMTQQYMGTQGMNGEGTLKTWYNEYTGIDYQKSNLTGWSNTINSNWNDRNTSSYTLYPWKYNYEQISQANRILANIDDVPADPDDETWRSYLKAQTLTYRAYFYSNLVKYYSRRWSDRQGESRGVVLRLEPTIDPMPASSLKACYAQIYKDLEDAIGYFEEALKDGIDRNDNEIYLPNLYVAYAVLSRAALNREDWATAQKYAELVIDSKKFPLMSASEYKAGFNAANSEWLWEAYNDYTQTIHHYGFFSYNGSNTDTSAGYQYVPSISRELVDQIPEGDARRWCYLIPTASELKKVDWNTESGRATSSKGKALYNRARKDYKNYLCSSKSTYIYAYMNFKFRAASGHSDGELCLFRTAEMLYNAAEAAYMQQNEKQAIKHLEAAVAPYQSGYECTKTGAALLDEIKLYRRFDLWGEGFSWSDLKRWGSDHIRKTWEEGGNFNPSFVGGGSSGGCYGPKDKNNWTWVYPLSETDYNPLVATMESDNWIEGDR